jgi:hypothetical protein bfra3_07766
LNKQGVYSEKKDKAYKKALIDLGIDLNSDFALFNLNTTEITFLNYNKILLTSE